MSLPLGAEAPDFGCMARVKPEFERRDTKIIGLSVDPIEKHEVWARDIEDTQGHAPNFPRLPDDPRPQLRRGAAGDRLTAADRRAQSRHAGELAHRPAAEWSKTMTPQAEGGGATRRPARIAATRPALRVAGAFPDHRTRAPSQRRGP